MSISLAGSSGMMEEQCWLRVFSHKAWVTTLILLLVVGRLRVQVLGQHVPFYLSVH